MKKKNCRCYFTDSRNEILMRRFQELIGKNGKKIRDVFAEISKSPAPRFYVSEERAYEQLRLLRKHGASRRGVSSRMDMAREIGSRVDGLMAADSSLSVHDAIFRVINSPAPSFYLTPGTIKAIIYRLLRARQQEWRRIRASRA